jgi:threonine dehydratase
MITRDDVVAAAVRIEPHVHRTPVFTSRSLDAEAGAQVFVKAENLQRVGAFKARGATNAVLQLPDDTIAVATHSSGNHGQALAFAASRRGLPAWIVMPDNAEPLKVAAVRGYGGTVVSCPAAEREDRVREIVAETGATLVHPFDDERVIAGQGTAALELLEDVPDLDVLIAPIGGGGLLSGTAVAVGRAATVIGAEPYAADDAYRSLVSSERQPGVVDPDTVADGLVVGIGAIPFAILSERGTEIVRVEEPEIVDAARFYLERMKLVVEPSGATPLAALRRERHRFSGARIGLIISGGNTNLSWYRPSKGDSS